MASVLRKFIPKKMFNILCYGTHIFKITSWLQRRQHKNKLVNQPDLDYKSSNVPIHKYRQNSRF